MRFRVRAVFAARIVPGDVEKEEGNESSFVEYLPFARQQALGAGDWQMHRVRCQRLHFSPVQPL